MQFIHIFLLLYKLHNYLIRMYFKTSNLLLSERTAGTILIDSGRAPKNYQYFYHIIFVILVRGKEPL